MRSAIVWLVLLATFLAKPASGGISVLPEEDQEIRIGNETYLRHTAEIVATSAGVTDYTVQTPDGQEISVEIVASSPAWVFTPQVVGYIPRAVYRVEEEVCLVDQQVDTTALQKEQNVLLGKGALTSIPNGPIYSPATVQTRTRAHERVKRVVLASLGGSSPRIDDTDDEYAEEEQRIKLEARRMTPWLNRGDVSPEVRAVLPELRASENRQLVEFAFSATVGRLSPTQRKLHQIVAGFLGGVVGGFLYNAFFGGGDGGVETALRDIGNQLQLQTTFDQQSLQWQNQPDRTNAYTYADLQAMQGQFNAQANIDRYLNYSLVHIEDAITGVSNELISGFSTLSATISGMVNVTATITNTMLAMFTKTQQQLRIIAKSGQNVDRTLSSFLALTWRWYRQTDLRTFLTKAITVDSFARNMDSIPTTPFTNGMGRQPLSDAVKTTLKNICNAPLVASVTMLYTTGTGPASYVARQIKYDVRCDQDFLINNVPPFVDFKTLLLSLGPGAVGSKCYQYPVTATCSESAYQQAWNCSCVIVRTSNQCTINGNKVWPWDFSTHPSDTIAGYENNTYTYGMSHMCTGTSGGSIDSGATTVTSNPPVYSYLSGAGGLFAAMNTDCAAIKSTGVLHSIAGKRVRITSLFHLKYIDLALTSDGCSYDSTLFLDQTSLTPVGFGYSIYRFWQLSLQLAQSTTIPKTAALWNGGVPMGVTATESIVARVPDSNTTVSPTKCARTEYTRIWNDPDGEVDSDPETWKLPVTVLLPVTVRHQFQVTVRFPDGQSASPDPTVSGDEFKCVNVTGQVGLTCLYTTLGVTADFSSYLPSGDPMYVAGYFGVGGNNDPLASDLLYDIPRFKWGSPGQCYCINYLYESADWPNVTASSAMNITKWMSVFGRFYKPECADSSAQLFMRSLDPDTNECKYFYDPRFPPSATTPQYIQGAGVDNALCNLYKRFTVQYDSAANEVRFLPKRFTMRGTVKFPKGKIIRTVSTACPSVTIDPGSGSTTIFLAVNGTTAVAVKYQVVSATGNHDCDQSGTVTIQPGTPAQLTIDACGYQLFNVFETGSQTPCFPVPLNMSVSQQVGGDATAGFATRSTVVTAVDGSVAAAAQVSAALSRAYYRLQQVFRISKSVLDARDRVNAIINAFQALANQQLGNLTSGLSQFQQQIQDQVDQIEQEREGIVNEQQQLYNQAQASNAAISSVNASMGLENKDTLVTNSTVQEIVIANKKTQDDINDLKDKSCSDHSPIIIGPIVCFFKHLWNSFLSIVTILIIVVIIWFAAPKLWQCYRDFRAKKSSSSGTSSRPLVELARQQAPKAYYAEDGEESATNETSALTLDA